jgi:hypothetical protein
MTNGLMRSTSSHDVRSSHGSMSSCLTVRSKSRMVSFLPETAVLGLAINSGAVDGGRSMVNDINWPFGFRTADHVGPFSVTV